MNEEVESSADADVSEVDVSASLVPPLAAGGRIRSRTRIVAAQRERKRGEPGKLRKRGHLRHQHRFHEHPLALLYQRASDVDQTRRELGEKLGARTREPLRRPAGVVGRHRADERENPLAHEREGVARLSGLDQSVNSGRFSRISTQAERSPEL